MNSLLAMVIKILCALMVFSTMQSCMSGSSDKNVEDISTTQEEAIKLSEVEEEAQAGKSAEEEGSLEFAEEDLEVVEGEKVEVAEEPIAPEKKVVDKVEKSNKVQLKQKPKLEQPQKQFTKVPASRETCQKLGYNHGNCLFVRTSKANVRSGPGKKHPVTRVLAFRQFVRIFGRSGKWIKISEKEWVSQKTLSAFLHSFRLKADAEVYLGPSDYFDVLRVIKKGSLVEVQGIEGKWAQVGENEYILRRRLGKRQRNPPKK